MRYMIKHLSILLLMCIAALYMPFQAFASSTVKIEGNTICSQIGEKVEVIFSIEDADNVCGGNFNIVYNSEYLMVTGTKAGDVFGNVLPVINTKYDTGKIRVTWAGLTPVGKSGTLIAVEFMVKDGAPSGDLNVNIENLRLYDYDSNVVEAQPASAKVNVKNTYLEMIPENNGDMVSVSIRFDGDTSCGGGNFVLSYDDAALIPVSVSKGILLTGATVTSNLSYTSNTLKVSWAGIAAVSEKGEIFKLVFDVVEGYEGTVEFSINSATLYDENSEALVVQSQRATLDIVQEEAMMPFVSIGKVKSSDEGVLSVTIDKNSMLCGGSVEIVYDNTAVEIVGASFGEALNGRTPALNEKFEQNVIKLTWAGILPMTVSGEILNISFKVIDPSKTFAPFTVGKLSLYDENMDSIRGSYENGGVAILCGIEDCITSTSYKKEEGTLIFESSVFNSPQHGTVVVALYKGNKMAGFGFGDISENGCSKILIDDCEFDSAKVMIWSNVVSLIPLSKAEELRI